MAQTLTQHVLETQKHHSGARGSLSGLITQIGVAAKILSAKVNRAGLQDVLGSAGTINVQGESVQKLDAIANRTMIETLSRSGHVSAMVSEEEQEWIEVPERARGDYVVVFDPLDGSSNIDVNVSVGTIFSIFRKASDELGVTRRDFLRPGRELVAAGYVIYGSSTMFVYSTGDGVHGFTLDPSVGEFLLSHPNIRVPSECKLLSINECNKPYWYRWTAELVHALRGRNDADRRRISARFIGSAVADVHRNLLVGGIFVYPADRRNTKGRLRLLYECVPLGFLVEQAGGAATNGEQLILDVQPHSLHQRSTLIVGNKAEVQLAMRLIEEHGLREGSAEAVDATVSMEL
jgi:fructose-1,6-bisphosphatase I